MLGLFSSCADVSLTRFKSFHASFFTLLLLLLLLLLPVLVLEVHWRENLKKIDVNFSIKGEIVSDT